MGRSITQVNTTLYEGNVLSSFRRKDLWNSAVAASHECMKRTVIWLTDQQTKALAAISQESLAPVSALVRQAVKEFLQKS